VELHAAHIGSVWQVETWEASALSLVYTTLNDVVSQTHVAHRLELLSRSVPSLKRGAWNAKQELLRSRGDTRCIEQAHEVFRKEAPRSYIGWGATRAFLARAYNALGQHEEAKQLCEEVLMHLTDADREYVSHFLGLEIQLATADAGLGEFDAAMTRVDGLLERFKDCDHPLVHGLLHEVRARICFAYGKREEYDKSCAQVEHWFLRTGTPALVAKCKRLLELKTELFGRPSVLPNLQTGSADLGLGELPVTRAADAIRTQTLCGTEVMASGVIKKVDSEEAADA
jgi:tetratricopeptide (TPR) repeat protein